MQAIVVVDLGFGDAGKGSLVDYYVRRHAAHTVIRFNGGAQAAHNVVTPDGRHHTFAQFGSGTFVPGVRTHLSRYMLVDPVALLAEEAHLRQVGVTDAFPRLTIDPAAPVVTPFQRAANRLRELARGAGRHGSCGMGIGETMADMLEHAELVIRAEDLLHLARVRDKLRDMQAYKRRQVAALAVPASPAAERERVLLDDPHAPEEFATMFAQLARATALAPTADAALRRPGTVVFEGAQGVLLDEWHGFHPYTTWSTTTFANALTLLREAHFPGIIRRIGAVRAYMTRHGAGPFVTEDTDLACRLPEYHNGHNPWQRDFRVGWPDAVMLRYALDVAGGADELAVTCLDRIAGLSEFRVCERYDGVAIPGGRLRVAPAPDLPYQETLTALLARCQPVYRALPVDTLVPWLQAVAGAPVTLTSHGPTWRGKAAYPPNHHVPRPDVPSQMAGGRSWHTAGCHSGRTL